MLLLLVNRLAPGGSIFHNEPYCREMDAHLKLQWLDMLYGAKNEGNTVYRKGRSRQDDDCRGNCDADSPLLRVGQLKYSRALSSER